MYLRVMILSVLLLGLGGFSIQDDAIHSPLEPLFNDDQVNSEARGIWQNLSYGWTVILSTEEIELYHYSKAGCLADPIGIDDLMEVVQFFEKRGESLILSASPQGSTLYEFQKLGSLPAACNKEPGSGPREVFEYFYHLMDAHYAFFDVHGVDWAARYEQYAPGISDDMSDESLFEAMKNMLEGLDDGHLVLRAEVNEESKVFNASRARVLPNALDAAFKAQEEIEEMSQFSTRWFFGSLNRFRNHVLDARGQGKAASGNMNWGRIGNIGYINVFGMGGFDDNDDGTLAEEVEAVHAAMDRALTDLGDTDALIFDVALNQGGWDEVSLALAGHFTDRPVRAYTKVGYQSTLEPLPLYVQPAPKTRYLKPVTLFTSDLTVSAAEIFTMAMRSLPNVVHRGDTTWGALSDILSKRLPNGWLLELSNEIYVDSEGKKWEGKGIPPAEKYTIFDPENIAQSHHNAILQIAQQMRKEVR